MSKSKKIGGILLIVGTSIGGGMLALPVSTAAAGMTHSMLFLIACWFIMTIGALLVLEVNARLPAGSNMISMAKSTLGLPGQIIAWITYLLLLYTLLSAYISGGTDVLNGLLKTINIDLPNFVNAPLFTLFFGWIIYSGIRTVDYVNRLLMFGKLGVYALLVCLISPYIHVTRWNGGSFNAVTGSLMILITSFGFASIIPSLRDYFEGDVAALRSVILFGSLIPLLCYIIWNGVIMGVIARTGSNGLLALMHSEHATSGLTNAIRMAVHSEWITGFFEFFTSICMITAFLGVSLGLFDFLADGLHLKKQGIQGKCTLAATFLPPLAIVLLKPGIYLHALQYAGICCVILLLLLPALMAWRGRQLTTEDSCPHPVLIPGGNLVLTCVLIVAISLLYLAAQ